MRRACKFSLFPVKNSYVYVKWQAIIPDTHTGNLTPSPSDLVTLVMTNCLHVCESHDLIWVGEAALVMGLPRALTTWTSYRIDQGSVPAFSWPLVLRAHEKKKIIWFVVFWWKHNILTYFQMLRDKSRLLWNGKVSRMKRASISLPFDINR